MIIAIDFDDTIHDKQHPIEGRRMGAPLEGAKQSLRTIRRRKHTIIIHTVMANTESGKKCVEDWMKYYQIPFHAIEPKVRADMYIDDRGYRFNDWSNTMSDIGRLTEK